MKGTYTFYEDPGHGWLAVPLKDLRALGIQNQISACSYLNGDTAYLEEDCDAPRFVEAYKNQIVGPGPVFTEKYQEHTPIRKYPHYYYC